MTCCAEWNVRRGRWRLRKEEEEEEEYGEIGSAVVKVEQGASHSTHRGQPKKSMQTKHRSTFRNIIAMRYRFFLKCSIKPELHINQIRHFVTIKVDILERLASQ